MSLGCKLLLGSVVAALSLRAFAEVRLFEHDNFSGRSVTANRPVADLSHFGFNDRASSAIVRGGRWVLCEDARYAGHCVTLRPGRYASLRAMGLNDKVSSLRAVGYRPPRPR